MGGRDHTTVMHGVRKITKLMEYDVGLKSDIDRMLFDLDPPFVATVENAA
jgi:hypothetical protein